MRITATGRVAPSQWTTRKLLCNWPRNSIRPAGFSEIFAGIAPAETDPITIYR